MSRFENLYLHEVINDILAKHDIINNIISNKYGIDILQCNLTLYIFRYMKIKKGKV